MDAHAFAVEGEQRATGVATHQRGIGTQQVVALAEAGFVVAEIATDPHRRRAILLRPTGVAQAHDPLAFLEDVARSGGHERPFAVLRTGVVLGGLVGDSGHAAVVGRVQSQRHPGHMFAIGQHEYDGFVRSHDDVGGGEYQAVFGYDHPAAATHAGLAFFFATQQQAHGGGLGLLLHILHGNL